MGALTSAAHPSTHHTCDGALGGVERFILQKLSPPPHVPASPATSIQRPRRSVTLSMIMSSFPTFSLRCCVEIITPTGTVSVWTPRTHRGVFGDVSLLQNTSHILSRTPTFACVFHWVISVLVPVVDSGSLGPERFAAFGSSTDQTLTFSSSLHPSLPNLFIS